MIAATEDRDRRRTFVLASEGWHAGVVGDRRLARRRASFPTRGAARHRRRRGTGLRPRNPVRPSLRGAPALRRYARALWRSSHGRRSDDPRRAAEAVCRSIRRRDRDDDAGARDSFPSFFVDARLDLEELGAEMMEDIDKLEPYGQANPRPLFLAEGLEVVSSRIVGERHLKLALRRGGGRKIFDAIAFGRAEERPAPGAAIDLLFSPELSRWEGYDRFQLIVKDLQDSSAKTSS